MITQNLQQLRPSIPERVTLVCVSKFHSEDAILEAYNAGERVFGESKVQELTAKQQNLPDDIQWHFIGHLQTNKVKYLVPFVQLIHGVDSVKLLVEINKQAAKYQRIVDCLLQVHIASEATKFGFSEAELLDFLRSDDWRNLHYVRIRGLMGMATFTDNEVQVGKEFKSLKNLFELIKSEFSGRLQQFDVLSMGMSDDYRLAITEGSNMVRIGSKIFGHRFYP